MQAVANMFPSREISGQCPIHGSYTAQEFRGSSKWLPAQCPMCFADRRNQADAEWQQQMAAERAAAKQRRIADQLNHNASNAGVPKRYQGKGFDAFRPTSDEEAHALHVCRDYADRLKANEGDNLALIGREGTGKTHLACAIVSAALQQGLAAVYTTVDRLLMDVRQAYSPDNNLTQRDTMRPFLEADLLVLDEVGRSKGSEDESRIIFNVIDSRYASMRPVVFVSNLRFESNQARPGLDTALGDFGLARIKESVTVLYLTGHSKRSVR